jgi:GNAT superfamily N-acetyltransferase
MKIRAYIPEDSPYVEGILRHIWGNEPWALRYYRFGPDSPPDSPQFLRTVVAEDGGRTVGFGTAWTNPFHPHALYVSVNVHPAMRGQGFGSQLLEALEQFNTRRLPLQGCTWETSVAGVRFLEQRGFVPVRRTWEPILDVADVDVDALSHFEERCVDLGYAILNLTDLVDRPDHEAKMAALLAEVYTATHSINPPRTMALQGWIDRLREDPPVNEATALAVQGDRYVALSAAHPDAPESLTITWAGVSEGVRQHERELMLALTLRQVLYAVRQGATSLQGEFDSTNPWSMIQLGALPFRPAPCWVTFQRLTTGSNGDH